MTIQEKVSVLKQNSLLHPEMTDRELSILIDAAFSSEDDENEED